MKELYINDSYHIQIDPESKTISYPINCAYCVKRMYAIQEPTLIVYRCGETEYTVNAEKGDVVCVLYHKDFKKEVIVIKNDELYDNLIDKHAREQQEKERWAEAESQNTNWNNEKVKQG